MPARRFLALAATPLLVLTLSAGPAALSAGPAALSEAPTVTEPSRTDALARSWTVTLITGDEVVVASGPTGLRVADIRPAPGRAHIRFFTEQQGQRLRVVPADAVRLLANGTLDARLFDVGQLARLEADRRGGALPLIIQYDSAASQRSAVADLPPGVRRTKRLDAINATAVTVGERSADDLWTHLRTAGSGPVDKVWLDGERRLLLDLSVPMVHAPEAWAAGYTGEGTTVAVLDSGLDATHPDLQDAVIESRNFTSEPSTDDNAGHGTHVASIVTGSGSASTGRYSGVAPDTRLLIGKVCEGFGSCPDSAIVAGMQWAAESGADVINLSLGGPDTPELDPLEQAVERLSADFGVVFVIAAGNSGEDGAGTVASPASADAAVAVGSVTKSGELSLSSSQGPRVGDFALKPDVVAPGVGIVAARARNGWMGGPVDDFYASMSGTSMASPHVAGAAAILVQRHPDWTPNQIKAALMGAADPQPGVGAFQQGSGLLDVAEATSLEVTTTPASVSFGIQRWPHDDDRPITRTVTYRNGSGQPVALDLSLRTAGPDGQPAPSGMFALDRSTVTVPAGGQAEVAITADTSVAAPDGHFTGWLVASDGAAEVTTAFGVDRSIEAYDVTFDLRGRDGLATGDYQLVLGKYGDESWTREPYDADGELTVRLPAGRYLAAARIAGPGANPTSTLLTMPDLRADADKRVVFDAASARPVSVTMPDASAALVDGVAAASAVISTGGEFGPIRQNWAVVADESWDGVFIGQVGEPVARDQFQATVSGVWARPNQDGSFDGSPYVYNWASFAYGSMPNGLVARPRGHDFAHVRATYAVQGGNDETFGLVGALGRSRDRLAFVPFAPNLEVPVPGSRTEYYSTRDIEWTTTFQQNTRVEGGGWMTDADQTSSWRAFRPGERAAVRWNGSVIGPSFAAPSFGDQPWVSRKGNELSAGIMMFADGNLDHVGSSRWDTGRTVLLRDGEIVAESEDPGFLFAELSAEEAEYRLEAIATRSLSDLSTRIEATWTFRSAATEATTALPVAALRFQPRLSDDGSAPAGGSFPLPVVVQRQAGVPAVPVHELSVEVSYDGGATWSRAHIKGDGDSWTALVKHPSQPGTVSLRAAATDRSGNTVTETIIDAYRID